MTAERDHLKEVLRQTVERLYNPPTLTELVMGDYAGIRQAYHMEIWAAMREYMHVEGKVTKFQNRMRQAVNKYFWDAGRQGWVDGGSDVKMSAEASDWLISRIEAEFGYVGEQFQKIRMMKADPDFTMKDADAEASTRADSYARSLDQAYNTIKAFAAKNDMLFLSGPDGKEGCDTCRRLKAGKPHRAKWWIAHDYIPGSGNSYDCHGYNCQHELYFLKDGKRFTL